MASRLTNNSTPRSLPTSRPATNDDRNRQLALHHATLLQQRKDNEATILSNLEELIEFPLDPISTSRLPAPSDIKHFTKLIGPFQDSDYDALIEERNCADKCGYVFCSKTLKRTVWGGNYARIVRGHNHWDSDKDHNLKIVPGNKFEMWCDKWCARAALYIKLQLSEVPAWERAVTETTDITILSDLTYGTVLRDTSQLASVRGNSRELQDMMEELALERGEKSGRTKMSKLLPLRERLSSQMSPPPPPQHEPEERHNEIEGFIPRRIEDFSRPGIHSRTVPSEAMVDAKRKTVEEDDQDWDLG